MIERDANNKMFIKRLDMSIFCDVLFEVCENRKEVERVVNYFVEDLLLAAQNKLKDLDDENPYDIDINI